MDIKPRKMTVHLKPYPSYKSSGMKWLDAPLRSRTKYNAGAESEDDNGAESKYNVGTESEYDGGAESKDDSGTESKDDGGIESKDDSGTES